MKILLMLSLFFTSLLSGREALANISCAHVEDPLRGLEIHFEQKLPFYAQNDWQPKLLKAKYRVDKQDWKTMTVRMLRTSDDARAISYTVEMNKESYRYFQIGFTVRNGKTDFSGHYIDFLGEYMFVKCKYLR